MPTASRVNFTLLDNFEQPPQNRNSFMSLQSTQVKISVSAKLTLIITWNILHPHTEYISQRPGNTISKTEDMLLFVKQKKSFFPKVATWCLGVCQEISAQAKRRLMGSWTSLFLQRLLWVVHRNECDHQRQRWGGKQWLQPGVFF